MNDLADAIGAEAERFPLHQLLRLLRQIGPAASPTMVRGRTGLAWPGAEVDAVERLEGGGHAVTTAIGALAGATGVLPNPYREAAADAVARQDEDGLVGLLGLFEARLGELGQAVWESGSLAVQEERDDPDGASRALDALNGEGGRPARMPDLRSFAMLLQPMMRGHAGFADLLAGLLGVPAAVDAFHPRWLRLPVQARLRLSHGGRSLGRQTWDRASAIQVTLGPCDAALAAALLEAPPGDAPALQRELAGLAAQYLSSGLMVHMLVVLAAEATPSLRLGRRGQALTPRIGRTAWLGSRPIPGAVVGLWLRPDAAVLAG
ncbi:MAG: type VI secretion system baseplate subunit TssG [Roseomonas sp.]|nr:type VI secretion system baseplate subunit TssG [Roseomonas sp.]